MKKAKRVLAIIGVILLIGLYLSTLFLAILGNYSNFRKFFMASAVATVMIPILIWIYSRICRLIIDRRREQRQALTPDVQDSGDEN